MSRKLNLTILEVFVLIVILACIGAPIVFHDRIKENEVRLHARAVIQAKARTKPAKKTSPPRSEDSIVEAKPGPK